MCNHTQTNEILARVTNTQEQPQSGMNFFWRTTERMSNRKFGYSLKVGTSLSILDSFLPTKEAGGRELCPGLGAQNQYGHPFTLFPLHPSHRGWRDSPVGESSLPSCRRSCHTSLPNPMGLNAVTWVTPVPAWEREEHHQGLLLWRRRLMLSAPQHNHQDITLTSHVLPSNSNPNL